jgi:hypothetical protein
MKDDHLLAAVTFLAVLSLFTEAVCVSDYATTVAPLLSVLIITGSTVCVS